MNDLEQRLRATLAEDAARAPLPPAMPGSVRTKVRRRLVAKTAATAVAAVAVLAGTIVAIRSIDRSTPDVPVTPPDTRPVFPRTATIGGLSVTSPSDWYLVDYWGAYNQEDSAALDGIALPVLEVTNFDPGLSTAVCDDDATERTRLPADGIAITVVVGDVGSDGACAASFDATASGTVDGHPYRSAMAIGPDVTEEDRAAAAEIWRSLTWTGFTVYTRAPPPAYVLDGWTEGDETWLLQARASDRGVELSTAVIGENFVAVESIVDADISGQTPIEGDTIGVVTEEAASVEYHDAGGPTPIIAQLVDLPPSLASEVDAYVFVPQPTGGPSEVVAVGADGEVVGSNLPPLVDTEEVGTVEAFGTTWTVKVSTSAEGGDGAICVEPAGQGSTQRPCERGWGGGMVVQSFDGPNPAVFVTQGVGDFVTAIHVQADDGRSFPAVMLPQGPGGSVAVVALEGAGRGRFVYSLADGTTDQGRREEAHVEWPDVGQVIGEFAPSGTT